MSAEIRVLETQQVLDTKQAEELLLSWLDDVRAGRIIQVGIVGAAPNGTVQHASSDGSNMHAMISALEILKWRIIEGRPGRDIAI